MGLLWIKMACGPIGSSLGYKKISFTVFQSTTILCLKTRIFQGYSRACCPPVHPRGWFESSAHACELGWRWQWRNSQSQITLVGRVVHTCEPNMSQAEAEDCEFLNSLGCVDHEFTTSLGYMDHEFATSLGCILRPGCKWWEKWKQTPDQNRRTPGQSTASRWTSVLQKQHQLHSELKPRQI